MPRTTMTPKLPVRRRLRELRERRADFRREYALNLAGSTRRSPFLIRLNTRTIDHELESVFSRVAKSRQRQHGHGRVSALSVVLLPARESPKTKPIVQPKLDTSPRHDDSGKRAFQDRLDEERGISIDEPSPRAPTKSARARCSSSCRFGSPRATISWISEAPAARSAARPAPARRC